MRFPCFAAVFCLALGSAYPSIAAASAPIPGSRAAVEKQLVMTTLVSGNLDIEPDGSVSLLQIDGEEKLGPRIAGFVRASALRWRFDPIAVDGKAVAVRSSMSARLIAGRSEQGNVEVRISGVSFGTYDGSSTSEVQGAGLRPPSYPRVASQMEAAGTVYVVLRIGRDGRVEDAVAEQVNLRAVGTEKQMQDARESLASGALLAAKHWTFRVPTEGASVDAPFWSVRVPVRYQLSRRTPDEDAPGHWVAYVPGPRQSASWLAADATAGFSPDALAEGGIYMVGVDKGPRLLTPLQEG